MKISKEYPTFIQRVAPYIGSLGLTAALFLSLPLMQWASDRDQISLEPIQTSFAISAPPSPPLVETPEIEEDEKEEDIELEKETMQLSIYQINLALNAGNGGMGGATLNVGSFQPDEGFGDDLVFDIADLDEKPDPIYRIAPKYPPQLKRMGIQGRVFLIFLVDENGNVGSVRVLEPPHPDFSESALETIRTWKFNPGKREGKPVKTRVRIPLSFAIQR
jgi:periplasmic protein TonB